MEFLVRNPDLSSHLQSHDLEELPFAVIATQFPQSNSLSPPGMYTIDPDRHRRAKESGLSRT